MIAKGQRYRTTKDIAVIAMTERYSFQAGAYERTLRAGEAFTVAHDPPDAATAAYCEPEDYARLNRELIPLWDRLCFWSYIGFYLCVNIADIEERCERLDG